MAKKLRFHLKDGGTLTPEEMLKRIAKDPERAAKVARAGLTIEGKAFLDELRKTALGEYVGDDGAVIVPEMLAEVAAAALVGAIVGFVVGVAVGVAVASGSSGDEGGDAAGGGNDNGDTGTSDGGETGHGGDGGGTGDPAP